MDYINEDNILAVALDYVLMVFTYVTPFVFAWLMITG